MVRFIPTNVGNMAGVSYAEQAEAVHPHECGEHAGQTVSYTVPDGSSPRMWGTCVLTDYSRMFTRFIPTDVGNILQENKQPLNLPVHPHECGEHSLTPDAWNT